MIWAILLPFSKKERHTATKRGTSLQNMCRKIFYSLPLNRFISVRDNRMRPNKLNSDQIAVVLTRYSR